MATGVPALAEVNPPDHYLCYSANAAHTPRGARVAGSRVEILDRLGGPQTFAVRRVAALCNPAGLDGGSISRPKIHLVGLTLRTERGAPRFTPSTVAVTDPFGSRTLALTRLWGLLDVTPTQAGTSPPANFGDDATTTSPEINRFKCYRADVPKGAPAFVASTPIVVADEAHPNGRQVLLKTPTKVCFAADVEGATPGAEARSALLVCYALKLPPRTTIDRRTIATRSRSVGVRILERRRPAELCVAARPFSPGG